MTDGIIYYFIRYPKYTDKVKIKLKNKFVWGSNWRRKKSFNNFLNFKHK